jgi:hypothetical protein
VPGGSRTDGVDELMRIVLLGPSGSGRGPRRRPAPGISLYRPYPRAISSGRTSMAAPRSPPSGRVRRGPRRGPGRADRRDGDRPCSAAGPPDRIPARRLSPAPDGHPQRAAPPVQQPPASPGHRSRLGRVGGGRVARLDGPASGRRSTATAPGARSRRRAGAQICGTSRCGRLVGRSAPEPVPDRVVRVTSPRVASRIGSLTVGLAAGDPLQPWGPGVSTLRRGCAARRRPRL